MAKYFITGLKLALIQFLLGIVGGIFAVIFALLGMSLANPIFWIIFMIIFDAPIFKISIHLIINIHRRMACKQNLEMEIRVIHYG